MLTGYTFLPKPFRKVVVAMVSTIETIRHKSRPRLTGSLELVSTDLTLLVFSTCAEILTQNESSAGSFARTPQTF